MFQIRVQATPFDPAIEQAALCAGQPGIGALVSFIGLTRDFNAGTPVNCLCLEHYPGMTEQTLAALVAEAKARWELQGVRLIHRIGKLYPETPIVLVAVAAQHRKPAFRACEFLIDALKIRVPFWKKEYTADGARWLDGQTTHE